MVQELISQDVSVQEVMLYKLLVKINKFLKIQLLYNDPKSLKFLRFQDQLAKQSKNQILY